MAIKELLPCPFCEHGFAMADSNGARHWFVQCKACGTRTRYHSRQADAVTAWNRRAAPPANAEGGEREKVARMLYGWTPKVIYDPEQDAETGEPNRAVPWENLRQRGAFGWEPGLADLYEKRAASILAALSSPVVGDVAAMPQGDSGAGAPVSRELGGVAEQLEEGSGFWRACSGCQEGEDGYVSERDYPYSKVFRCQPGGGCRECGGLGVIWDDTDYDAMACSMLDADTASPTASTEAGEGKLDQWRDEINHPNNRLLFRRMMEKAGVVVGEDDIASALKKVAALSAPAPSTEALVKAVTAFVQAGGANPAMGQFRFSFWSLDKLAAAFDLAVSALSATPTNGGDDAE